MTHWEKLLVRSFGVLHLVYGAVGILLLLQGFPRISRVQLDKYPYEREFYDFDVTVEVFLVFALIGAGVLLVQSVSARSNPVELHLRHRNCTFHG